MPPTDGRCASAWVTVPVPVLMRWPALPARDARAPKFNDDGDGQVLTVCEAEEEAEEAEEAAGDEDDETFMAAPTCKH